MKLWAVFLALMLALTSIDALAQKRFGGGGSFGQQSGNVQRKATPTQPAQAPGQRAGQQASPNQAKTSRPWGMLGGLATALGLVWLASWLGLDINLTVFLFLLLVGSLAIVIADFLFPRARPTGAVRAPLTSRGSGKATAAPAAQGGSLIGSALIGSQSWGVPVDFDRDGFVRASKSNFIRIQRAWDEGDISALRALMTDEMVEHIKEQIKQRGGQTQRNEVLEMDARLLGIEDRARDYMASVEFSVMMREDGANSPTHVREVWNITRPKSGPGGWLVAGVQALD